MSLLLTTAERKWPSFAVRVVKLFLSIDSLKMVYLFLLSFRNDLWINILGGIPIIVTFFSDYKKELLESFKE